MALMGLGSTMGMGSTVGYGVHHGYEVKRESTFFPKNGLDPPPKSEIDFMYDDDVDIREL